MKKGLFLVFFLLFSLICSFYLVSAVISNLEIDSSIIKSVIKDETSVNQTITLVNTGNSKTFIINGVSKYPFFYTDELLLDINKGESASFTVVLGSSELKKGIYAGYINLSTERGNNIIPVILEVESRELLFDALVEIDPTSIVSGSNEVSFDVSLYNLGFPTKNAIFNYSILSLNGETLSSEQETVDIERQVRLTKNLILNTNRSDDYVLAVYVQQGASVGTSAVLFSYPRHIEKKNFSFVIAAFIIIVLLIFFLIINYLWKAKAIRDAKNWSSKISEINKIKFSDNAKKIRRLQYQLNVLERAYSSHYVTKESYMEGKRQITSLIAKLKKRL